MATETGISLFLETLEMSGLLSERKGAPSLTSDGARRRLASMWLVATAELSDDQLEQALFSYLRNAKVCQWYPQPGTLLDHVPGRRETAIDTADELWGRVVTAVQNGGYYSTPTWTGPDAKAIEAGIHALGGWQHLCSTLSVENQSAERASFRAVVRTMQQRRALEVEQEAITAITAQAIKRIERDRQN